MRPILVMAFLSGAAASAQPRILHFTRTSGFDHGTRSVSYAMFQSIAQEAGGSVDDDQSGNPFSDAATLAAYDVIVFSNTSGNAILNAQQRSNFEDWVAGGGRVLGIHAASDTYRHSTANGGGTGAWDFYAELIGASVQEAPNHVNGTPPYSMQRIGSHASTANLPDPWVKNEEYYYWEGGYYAPGNVEVLRVEETVGPNGQVNSYDAPRPMSWYRELPGGSRVFYTALGHATENYTIDALFRTHIKDALEWLLAGSMGTTSMPVVVHPFVHPNPATDAAVVVTDASWTGTPVQVLDATGRVVLGAVIAGERTTVMVQVLPAGSYVLRTPGAAIPIRIIR